MCTQTQTAAAVTTDVRRSPLDVRLELAVEGGQAQLAERLRLDLADALAGELEALADFLESSGDACSIQTTAHFENFALFWRKFVQNLLDLVAQNAA